MSEYQYYEWQTIDRPLSAQQQKAVNALSSHIDVTSTRAEVSYNWGDFKHDPIQVLARYFDAFLYFANWGTRRVAFRFPAQLLDAQALRPYLRDDAVQITRQDDHTILEISSDSEEWDGWAGEGADLSQLARLRDDILRGDLRALYIAWLGMARYYDTEDDVEPPPPPGLDKLSAPLAALAEFLGVGQDIIAAAAEGSPTGQDTPTLDLAATIEQLTRDEANAFLLRLANDEAHLSLVLTRRLQELAGAQQKSTVSTELRTWDDLSDRAATLGAARAKRAAAAAEAARIRDLEAFEPLADQAWREVHHLLREKKARPYQEATALLVKLRDLAIYRDQQADFSIRMREVRDRYSSRPAFIRRLNAAKLP